jgi:class 3 adenylate cyclase
MALDLLHAVEEFNDKYHQSIRIRVGINTGPVVAGVIGKKKFIYDLWGDAVNLASRMESCGEVGCIQVSESTYRRLRSKYVFQERGLVTVKGKGKITSYWLTGRQLCSLPAAE